MAIHAQHAGIEFDFHNEALSDFRTLGLFSRAQKGDITAIWDFAVCIFGEEQLGRILDALPSTDMESAMGFINGAVKAAAAQIGENPKN